jgi:hypothetical protein
MIKREPTYILVPKKLIIALGVMFTVMLIMTLVSTQAAYYVDRRSNQRWCGIVNLIDDANAANPPPTKEEQEFAVEIHKIREDFDCRSI